MSEPGYCRAAYAALEDILYERAGGAERRLKGLGDWEIRAIREAAAQLAALCRHLELAGKEDEDD